MLSCDRLRINCQSYKAFLKKFPKDSGRFFMIILIYFHSYHYHHCHCYYYYYYYCYHCHIVLFTLSLSLSLSLSSSSWLVLLLLLLFFSFLFISVDFIFLLSFQAKDKILSSMAEVNVTDISEATQLTTIAVLATRERSEIPLKTLASTKLIDNSLEANRASHFSEIHSFRNVDTNLLRRTRINKKL